MRLALKIDVDTWRGTRKGVPRLLEVLARHRAGATFLFSLGPDHTGRALTRVFRRGFAGKVMRTSVVQHYGLKTLLYGTLLPGPDIGRGCADLMRRVRDAGFETGIHCWDHVRWQDHAASADAAWIERELALACDRFAEIFGAPAKVHGAAGWQTNGHALRRTQQLGFEYCSDTRGTHPFIPVCEGEAIACPQIPTTLPTLDELIGLGGVDASNVADAVLARTRMPSPDDHVYTLHAELEGGRLMPAFETILAGWRTQGYQIVPMREIRTDLDARALPRHAIAWGPVPGRSGMLALQGPPA